MRDGGGNGDGNEDGWKNRGVRYLTCLQVHCAARLCGCYDDYSFLIYLTKSRAGICGNGS